MKSANKDKQSRFLVNERVLCYEPDLTKARVVYDAKILKADLATEGKKTQPKDFHYLVHFQGWSSTWDRYVTEEFLLKITEENRNLQKKLFLEAEAATLALKKKAKSGKKRKRSSNESLSISISEPEIPSKKEKIEKIQPSPCSSMSSKAETESSSISSVSPLLEAKKRQRQNSQDSVQDSENQAPVRLPDELKVILEADFHKGMFINHADTISRFSFNFLIIF